MGFCYVAVEKVSNQVAGYYTLSATGIALSALPSETAKRVPRYPLVPAVLIGRLAVDRRFRGRKLGGVLLFDAIRRTLRSEIAAFAVVVDAKDDAAVVFYERYGFQRFHDLERKLFLPISDALKRLAQSD